MSGYIFWREQCMEKYKFLFWLPLFWYICNQKWSFLLHKMIKNTIMQIFWIVWRSPKNPLGNCSQTCVLSSGYITFFRNLQKWNLICFQNAFLTLLLLNCYLWQVRSGFRLNCFKTKEVWNFIYKKLLFYSILLKKLGWSLT
jgi:hypothetical protein